MYISGNMAEYKFTFTHICLEIDKLVKDKLVKKILI